MIIAQLQAMLIGFLFFFKRSGDRRSNAFFGSLLILFSFTLLHYILIYTGIYEAVQEIQFIPIYFTLSLPVFLFYHIKLMLFPTYKLRWTDAKHFILPAGQVLYFLITYFSNEGFQGNFGRKDGSLFYGALEQFLYLLTFFAYLYFSYRYILVKKRVIRHPLDAKKVWYTEKLVQVFFFLFCLHAGFMLVDYFVYAFWQIDLRANRVFAALGMLSFVALLMCLGTYGFQVLIWGRKLLNQDLRKHY
ncbi:MAG: hypothetical protein Sapg2KO_11440 [Saprospiraceae bacterium]